MKKLLNRKGFTLVELIVVIAMMAVLLAILVPIFSTADARKDEAKDYARSFYSNVQELMTDERVSKNTFFNATGGTGAKYLLVCAEVDERVTTTDGVKVSLAVANNEPAAGSPVAFSAPSSVDGNASYAAFDEFAGSLQKLLAGGSKSGYYFAVVDSKFRVVSTYFANTLPDDTDLNSVWDGGLNNASFTAFYIIGERIVGAWPESLCDKGVQMFAMP